MNHAKITLVFEEGITKAEVHSIMTKVLNQIHLSDPAFNKVKAVNWNGDIYQGDEGIPT